MLPLTESEGTSHGTHCSENQTGHLVTHGMLENAARAFSDPAVSCSLQAVLHLAVEECLLKSNRNERSSKEGLKGNQVTGHMFQLL